MTSKTSTGASIPKDKVNLRMIVVSGRIHECFFSPTDSAAIITQHVYDNWPQDWGEEEERPDTNILRLIYQGKFLHQNVTLGALNLPTGRTAVMHLVPRENLPEPNNKGQQKRDKRGDSGCANCCTLL